MICMGILYVVPLPLCSYASVSLIKCNHMHFFSIVEDSLVLRHDSKVLIQVLYLLELSHSLRILTVKNTSDKLHS